MIENVRSLCQALLVKDSALGFNCATCRLTPLLSLDTLRLDCRKSRYNPSSTRTEGNGLLTPPLWLAYGEGDFLQFAQSFATGGFPLQIALRSPFLLSVILPSLACTDASDGGR